MTDKLIQPVFFDSEEILSPRELKDKYFIGVRRSDNSNRPYSLEEVKAMLQEGSAHMLDPDKPASRATRKIQENPCLSCTLRGAKCRVNSSGDWKTAKIVFVGEAPGENEENQGVPFVGRAGQLLRTVLQRVGIDATTCVFSNVCRCRPPENRTPTEREIVSCLPYLEQELETFKGLIVLLGGTATSALLDKTGIGSLRGYGFVRGDQHFFVTYHPSFVLRNQTAEVMGVFENDLKKVKKSLDFSRKIDYNMLQTERELTSFLQMLEERPQTKMAFDIETTVLHPFEPGAKILTSAFSFGLGKENNFCVPVEHPESPFLDQPELLNRFFSTVLRNENLRLIGQNGKFDLKWFWLNRGVKPATYWFDTQVAQYLVNGLQAPQGLKEMAWQYTDFGGYGLDRGSMAGYSLEETANYNVLDSCSTYLIEEKLYEEMSPQLRELMTKILAPATLVLVEMEANGLPIHEENLLKMMTEYQERISTLEVKMHSYPEVKKIEEKRRKLINFGSPQQLGTVFKEMGLETTKKTRNDNASTDYEALMEIKDKHPIVNDLIKWREASKVAGTYFVPYAQAVQDHGPRIYAEYLMSRTATGRLACQKPNLQNIPYEARPAFTTSLDYLLEADYSQLELRVMAMYSKDPAFVKAFCDGEDIHERTRRTLFGDNSQLSPLQKTKQRVRAKSFNFAIIYGASEFGLAQQIDASENETRSWLQSFFGQYKEIKEFMDHVKAFVLQHGYFETFFGRRRYFRVRQADEQRLKRYFREAINFPIQSTARDLVFDAEGRIWKEMRKRNMRSHMIADVHDAALFNVADDELSELITIIKTVAEDFRHIPWVNVPLVVDIKIGKVWGQLEEL